jgi:hypothetical protein
MSRRGNDGWKFGWQELVYVLEEDASRTGAEHPPTSPTETANHSIELSANDTR